MPAPTTEQQTNTADAPPGHPWRMVTVRMPPALHSRLLAASQCYAVPGGRPSMNRLCIDAIEAALDALDAEATSDEQQSGRGSAGTTPSPQSTTTGPNRGHQTT